MKEEKKMREERGKYERRRGGKGGGGGRKWKGGESYVRERLRGEKKRVEILWEGGKKWG